MQRKLNSPRCKLFHCHSQQQTKTSVCEYKLHISLIKSDHLPTNSHFWHFPPPEHPLKSTGVHRLSIYRYNKHTHIPPIHLFVHSFRQSLQGVEWVRVRQLVSGNATTWHVNMYAMAWHAWYKNALISRHPQHWRQGKKWKHDKNSQIPCV